MSTIAIIGAGPAGLTLARLLSLQQNFKVTVFEQDASASSRTTKGGSLDLHGDTGMAALREAGLVEEFLQHARYEGEDLVIADKHGNRHLDMKADVEEVKDLSEARPEIDREVLKAILLESIPPPLIKWGHHLTSVGQDGTLSFAHGAEGPFDLIVGADGAWSRVAQVLTDVRPSFSGIGGFELRIFDPAEMHPKVSDMVGRGSYFAFSDGQGVQAQRQGDGSIIVYIWERMSELFAKNLLASCDGDGGELKGKLKERFSSWDPSFLDWIDAADSKAIRAWPLYELPVGHQWRHKKGFTLIGDSGHIMTPFAGEGVNAAMKDALDLAGKIGEALKLGSSLDSAVEEYEVAAFTRNQAVQEDTMQNKILFFREDAPAGFLERMQQLMGQVPEEERERWEKMIAGVDTSHQAE